jgi:hypothetical protein
MTIKHVTVGCFVNEEDVPLSVPYFDREWRSCSSSIDAQFWRGDIWAGPDCPHCLGSRISLNLETGVPHILHLKQAMINSSEYLQLKFQFKAEIKKTKLKHETI